jgi:endonuclease/exonuclease/phosphatase family metal-dependent hydrolase
VSDPSPTLTVSSFNVHWGGRGADPRETYDLAAASASLPGTVRAFQEVWDHPAEPDRVVVPTGWNVEDLVLEVARRRPKRLCLPPEREVRAGRISVRLATEHEVLDRWDVPVPPAAGDARDTVLATRLATPLGELVVVAVHLVSKRIPVGPARQVRALRRALPDGPTVVLGDHNLWAAMTAPLMPGFTLAVRGATFPAQRPRHQIDHIWVRGVTVVDGEVLPPLGSDHLAVTATLA